MTTSTTAATETTGTPVTLRQIRDALPRPAVLHLIRLALAEGHTPDGTTGVVVEHVVASGELADTPQLRALIATWTGIIASQRKPPRRRAAVAPLAEPEEAIEQPPDTAEERC